MVRYTQKSFTGGVLSPSLYARNDLAKYAIGLKTLKNGFVRAEGCVSNRAGLEMICEVKDSSSVVRLLPFSFNTEQTYIIELGENVVPNFHITVALTTGFAIGRTTTVLLTTVKVNFTARTARTCAMLPEIVGLAHTNYSFFGNADNITP